MASYVSRPVQGFTFVVDNHIKPSVNRDLASGRSSVWASQNLTKAWESTTTALGNVEAMLPAPDGTVEVFSKQNLLAKAIHKAFHEHHPLILSPDIIWLSIAQGLANHVDKNAEHLRRVFIDSEERRGVSVQRDGFVKGSSSSEWESIIPEFVEQIRANLMEQVLEFIACDFSTSGTAETIASHITLMDTVKQYFDHTMTSGCGFPRITLSGMPEDWTRLRAKAEKLRPFDLNCTCGTIIILKAPPASSVFVETSTCHSAHRVLVNSLLARLKGECSGLVLVIFSHIYNCNYHVLNRVARRPLTCIGSVC
eukprot:m.468236 g.468236  ORF g.468236 m.468236 type:complete len:310 (-) comp21642_c1_seq46:2066-2995(-)